MNDDDDENAIDKLWKFLKFWFLDCKKKKKKILKLRK